MIWLLFLALSFSCRVEPAASLASTTLSIPGIEQPAAAAPENRGLRVARERFTAAVINGRLKGFNDLRGQVAFKRARRVESDHRPGPMEDDVIASTLRNRIVSDPSLGKLGLKVSSQAGKVVFNGAANDAGALAKLIVLALELDGVTRVRADLPATLRIRP